MSDNQNCRLCDGPLTAYAQQTLLGKHEVAYFRCESCKSLQTETPYWLDEAYDPALPNYDVGACERNLQLVMQMSTLLRQIGFGAGDPSLDYGGGDGVFTRMMRDRGFDFQCYDKYRAARYAYGHTCESLKGLKPKVVTAFEVFEHLVEPKQELGAILDLKPDAFFFTTELFSGQGMDWPYLAPHEGQHVFFYSPDALTHLAGNRYQVFEFGIVKALIANKVVRALMKDGKDLGGLSAKIRGDWSGWMTVCLQEFAQHQANPWTSIQRDHAALLEREG
jgi:hypothetical protein